MKCRKCVALAIVTLALTPSISSAESVLYDNTDHVWSFPHNGPKNVLWIGTGGRRFPTEEYRFISAQQFFLGGHDNISSVSIPIGLENSTPATGSFRVTLWNSNEDGFPKEEIGEFGVLDFSSLEVVGDFDIPASAADNEQELPTVSFDSPVDGLIPGAPYYLVFDFNNLPVSRDGAVLGLTNSTIGANGAGGTVASPDNPVLPLENADWTSISQFFSHGKHVQMRIVSEDDSYEVVRSTVGETYTESFDSMGTNGERGFLPTGWAYYDEIVEHDVEDPSDDEPIYNNYLTDAFPPDLRLSGPAIFNAGVPGESDRALALGTHSRSNESTIQYVTEVTGGAAQSIQLSFDVEAWESDRSRDNPGEAAFNIALDVDTGNGFEQVMDLGHVTTGATLIPATEEFVNGNDEAYRTSFNSEMIKLDLPEGSQLRVRWMADLEAETRGWVYGLDNVSLSLFANTMNVLGDFDGDGQLTANDIDLLTDQIGATPADLTFDVTGDGMVNLDDRTTWVHDVKNTYFGDSNLDGEFNSGDLTEIFKAGEYEDDIMLNSTWSEGDWNGDGDFDSGDLVAAFTDGGYEMGPRAAVVTVPEPSGWILVMLSLLGIGRMRKR